MLKYALAAILAVTAFTTSSANAQVMEERCTIVFIVIKRCEMVPVQPVPRPGYYYGSGVPVNYAVPPVETIRSADVAMERSEIRPLCPEGKLVDGPDGTKACEKHWSAAQLAGNNSAHLEGQQPECAGQPSGTMFVRMGTGPDGRPASLKYRCR